MDTFLFRPPFNQRDLTSEVGILIGANLLFQVVTGIKLGFKNKFMVVDGENNQLYT